MNIYYHLSSYVSHRRAGEAYIASLRRLGHTLVDSPEKSDLAVLHDEPSLYPAILQALPRPPAGVVVGYAVWETPVLPQGFCRGLDCVDAIWTCSDFSRQAFAPHIPTFVLPHVVHRPKISPRDIAWGLARLGLSSPRKEDRDTRLFYTIIDTINPRKNAAALFAAFALAFPDPQEKVRLVVKQYRTPQDLSAFPHILDIPEDLTDGRIAALHALCDVYLSAHHAEAWGLPLSEALSFGNPVIATGYSGNMAFMTEANSFPIAYSLVPVSPAICRALPGLFSPEMLWADIDIAAFIPAIRAQAARPAPAAFRAAAAESMAAFGPAAVDARLSSLLADIRKIRLPGAAR